MKKAISVSLVILMAMFWTIPAYAASVAAKPTKGISMSPQYTSISVLSAGLSIDSSGRATCSGTVTPSSNSYTSHLTVSLQQHIGSSWSTIKSWTASGTGFMGADVEGYYYVDYGSYRVCSTASVYNSSGKLLETESFYSAVRTY
jgi:hypothetical protein